MGLDMVELFIGVEKEFEIRIPDVDAGSVRTVQDLADVTWRLLAEADALSGDATPDAASVLQRVRELIVAVTNHPLDRVRAESRFIEDLGMG